MLTKEQILTAEDLPREKVEVPEWGGHVYVQTLTARAKEEWETSMLNSRDENKNSLIVRASLAVLTCCTEDGERLFTPDDIDDLNEKSGSALEKIFSAASGLNKVGDSTDVDESAKNSQETPDDDSPSD